MATGYVREDPVGAVGEFSMRGGILDVWPPGREAPVRLEFFGDTVDSLREFDPENQLSTRQLQVVHVPPMHELAVTPVDFQLWSEAARERWSDQRFARSLRDRTAFADESEAFAGWEWLMPIVMNTTSNIFEHLGDVVFVVDEPAGIEGYLSEFYERLSERYSEIDQADDIALTPDELFLTAEELRQFISLRQRVELRTLAASLLKQISIWRWTPKPESSTGPRTRHAPARLLISRGRKRGGSRMEVTIDAALSRAYFRPRCGSESFR